MDQQNRGLKIENGRSKYGIVHPLSSILNSVGHPLGGVRHLDELLELLPSLA
jgi:hypothetical protein